MFLLILSFFLGDFIVIEVLQQNYHFIHFWHYNSCLSKTQNVRGKENVF